MTTWTKELDEASELATKRGYWHIVLFYLLCGLASIPTSLLVFSQVFTNATPDHWCSPPEELRHLNLSEDLLRNLTVPQGPTPGEFDSCHEYYVDPRALYIALAEYVDERSEVVREGGSMRLLRVRQLTTASGAAEREEQISRVKEAVLSVRNNTPTACSNGWTYSTELYSTTLVTKFNLVCDNDWWPRLSNFLFWVGSIFGNFFFGWMSDKYGRRPTILLMVYLEVPLSIMTAFCGDYVCYTVLRICCGLFFPALYQQPFILALELMPPEIRPRAGIVVSVMFAGGMCLLAFMAYCLRDWFTLSLATSLPFVLLYSYYWLIPESPRWLVGRGRVAEAEKVFRNLAKKNGIKLTHGFLLDIHKKVKEEEDVIAETTTLASINGHLASELQSAKNLDRRLSKMISFKPDTPVPETEDNKTESIEKKLALEVAEIVNKRTKEKEPKVNLDNDQNSKDVIEEDDVNEESQLNIQSVQKSTQTDEINKSPADTLRRKSIQFVSKIFIKEDYDSDPEIDKKMDDQNSVGDCKATLFDIFRYPNIRRKFLLLTFNWVALGVAYNGLSYNTPNLGVDDYLAFFIGGAVEIPSYFLAWKCMDKFGRRWVLCSFLCVGGITCLSCMFVPDSLPWVTVTLAMIGRLLTAASFAVFYVLIGELLPTVLRAQAMGAASFVAGIGLLACPYIVYLAVFSKSLPLVIIGTLALMAGVTSLFLPETLHQPLPQTLTDGELFGQNLKIFSCVAKPKKKDYAYT